MWSALNCQWVVELGDDDLYDLLHASNTLHRADMMVSQLKVLSIDRV